MQTLTAGSFLNLENDANVEALKFTARRLAEHSGNVVTENLNAAALENLADSLWEKAAYVTRETERRRLKQNFVENFTERFREIKPGASATEDASDPLTMENSCQAGHSPRAAEIAESGESTTAESSYSATPPDSATEAEGKTDEFLGFVKTNERVAVTSLAVEDAVVTTVSTFQGADQAISQKPIETASEALKTEDRAGIAETPISENERVDEKSETAAENGDVRESQTLAASPIAAKSNAQSGCASKNPAQAGAAADAKEPFEFDKCTINLNLVLLPRAGESGARRKALLSVSSHNLPPEIDFVEIPESEDLTGVADLVRQKLARFKATLPAKYIEQLRASAKKTAKRTAPAKPVTAAPASTPGKAGGQTEGDKKSGEQEPQSSNEAQTGIVQTSIQAPAPIPTVTQTSASANNVQPSLF